MKILNMEMELEDNEDTAIFQLCSIYGCGPDELFMRSLRLLLLFGRHDINQIPVEELFEILNWDSPEVPPLADEHVPWDEIKFGPKPF